MNQFLKGLVWTCLGIIPFLAWYVADSMFFPFITGKNFMFRLLVEIALASWLVIAIKEPMYRLRGSLLVYMYGAFVIAICIADAVGVDPHASFWSNYERMEGFVTHIHLFAYFIVLYSFLKSENSWNRLMGLFVAANVPVLMEGFMQLFGRPEFLLAKWAASTATYAPTLSAILSGVQSTLRNAFSVHMSDSLRVDSSLGNAAYYGIYTLFNLIFAIVLIVKAEKMQLPTKKEAQNEKVSLLKRFSTWIKFNFKGISALLTLIVSSLIVLYSTLMQMNGNTGNATMVYLAGMIALLVAVYYFAKGYIANNIGRGVLTIIAIMNLIQLYYTQTRGSYLGLVGGIIIAVLFFVTFKIKIKVEKMLNKGNGHLHITLPEGKLYKRLRGFIITFGILLAMGAVAGALVYGVASAIANNKDSNFVKNNVFLNRLATINIINPIKGFELVQNETLTYEDLNKYFGDITIVSRFLNAKIAVEAWHQRPLLGYGQENYKNVFEAHFDPRMYSQEAWFDRTHNVFFDWLVAGGIIGLILYLALYLTPFYIMWIGHRRDSFKLVEKSAISGLLVAYFIHNIFVFDNLISYVLFFMILAYVAGHTNEDTDNKKHYKIGDTLEVILSILIAITLIAVIYFVNWRAYAVNLGIAKGLQYKQIASILASRQGDVASAISATDNIFDYITNENTFGKQEALEQYITGASELYSIQPSSDNAAKLNEAKIKMVTNAFMKMDNYVASNTLPARTLTIFAGSLAQLGLYDKSLTVLDKALAQTPKKQILLNFKAQLLATKGKYNEAYQVAKTSYLLDPTFKTSESLFYSYAGRSKNGVDFVATIKKIKVAAGASTTTYKLPYSEENLSIFIESAMYKEAMEMLNDKKKVATSTEDKNRLKLLEKEMYKSMYSPKKK